MTRARVTPALSTPQSPPSSSLSQPPPSLPARPAWWDRPLNLDPWSRSRSAIAPPLRVAASLRHAATVRGHRYAIYCLAWSPDGQTLITGSDDGLVKLWGARTAALAHTCRAHRAEVTDLAVSPCGALVASGGCDHEVWVWRLSPAPDARAGAGADCGGTGSAAAILTGHSGAITFVEYAPRSTPAGSACALLSSSFDGTVRLWDGSDGHAAPRRAAALPAPPHPYPQARTALAVLRPGPQFGLGGGGGRRRPASPPSPPLRRAPPRRVVVVEDEDEEDDSDASGARGRATRRSARRAAAAAAAEAARAAGTARARRRHGRGRTEEEWEEEERQAWEARYGAPAAGHPPPADSPPQPPLAAMVCGFSGDATSIMAGGDDGALYVWAWSGGWGEGCGPAGRHAAAAGASFYAPSVGVGAPPPPPPPPCALRHEGDTPVTPPPTEIARLGGAVDAGAPPGAASLLLLQFSRAGDAVAAASKDGRVVVWRPVRPGGRATKARGTRRGTAWREALTLDAGGADAGRSPARPRAARRGGAATPPPPSYGVNQVAWSADDAAILAAAGDASVRVWCAATGAPLATLFWHGAAVHVLEPHPVDPALLLTASYDGTAAVWDWRAAKSSDQRPLASWSVRAAYPAAGGVWPDAIPIADGRWSPAGDAFALADVGGQWHAHESGPSPPAVSRSRYDQFLWRDYDRLAVVPARTDGLPAQLDPARVARAGRSAEEVVALLAGVGVGEAATLDASTGEHPWALDAAPDNGLVDFLGGAYPRPYVEAARARRLGNLPPGAERVEADGAPPRPAATLPRAARAAPPTLTAAAWLANEADGSTEATIAAAVRRAEVRFARSEAAIAAVAAAADAAPRPPRARPVLPHHGGGSSDEEGGAAAVLAARRDALMEAPRLGADIPARLLEAGVGAAGLAFAEWANEEEEEEEEVRAFRNGAAGGQDRRAEEVWSDLSSDGSGGSEYGRSQGSGSDDEDGSDSDSDDSSEEGSGSEPGSAWSEEDFDSAGAAAGRGGRAARAAVRRRVRAAPDADARVWARRVRRRRGAAAAVEEEEEVEADDGTASGSSSADPDSLEEDDHGGAWWSDDDDDDAQDDDEASPSPSPPSSDGEDGGAEAGGAQRPLLLRWAPSIARPRPRAGWGWLAGAATAPGVYVPQVGDAVAYLPAGHDAAVASGALAEANGRGAPATAWARGGVRVGEAGNALAPPALGPAEPCAVLSLSFDLDLAANMPARDAGLTHAVVRLALARDPDWTFSLTLPHPALGGADFLVPAALFEGSAAARWAVGDRVAVWFAADDASGGGDDGDAPDPATPAGRFYGGVIREDSRVPSPAALAAAGGDIASANVAEVAADPWAAGGLWGRFRVAWDGEEEEGEVSPWELWPPGTTPAAARGLLGPALAPYARGAAADAVASALGDPRFALFASTPTVERWEPGPGSAAARRDPRSPTDPPRPVAYTAAIPLPFSLADVGARLAAGYYRQAAAFCADTDLIAANAADFNGVVSDVAAVAADLAGRLKAAVLGGGEDGGGEEEDEGEARAPPPPPAFFPRRARTAIGRRRRRSEG